MGFERVRAASDLLTPDPPGFPWQKLGLALGATTLIGALAYRIAHR